MSEHPYPNLFSPFKLRGLTLPNRLVMAPMGSMLGDEDGTVTPRQVAYYRARAEGGVGMIIIEFCSVHRASGRAERRQICLDAPNLIDSHRRLTQAIASAGAVACTQLHHGGIFADKALVDGGITVGPSDLPSQSDSHKSGTRALTESEIEHLIECFGQAAERAVEAGYQVIEIHGAHGYLISSFLSPFFNHRQDAWGGDEERRLNFPLRVIRRVRQAVGDRPLLYRLSAEEFVPSGLTIVDTERIAPKLVAAGVDVLDVSTGVLASLDKVIEPISAPEGWRLPYARRIRAAVSVPVIAVGQIREPAMAEKALRDGDADFIALGRALLSDPEWPNKVRQGEEQSICPCISCNYCVGRSLSPRGSIGCSVFPRAGRELDKIPLASSTQRGQRAIVIGGGPGGMAASLMLDRAGFKAELHEQRPILGGGLIASAASPYKSSIGRYQSYLERQLQSSGVAVNLGVPADMSTLNGVKPAIVVLATGGRPIQLPIPGIDGDIVHDAYDLLMGDESLLPPKGSLPVVVYGGGETGCETAEYLSERNYDVVLVSRSPSSELARSAEMIYRGVLRKRLAENRRIRIIENTAIVSISADGTVALESTGDAHLSVKASRVMIAQGRKPDTDLAGKLREANIPFAVIGDARGGGRIGDAVSDAYAMVMSLCNMPEASIESLKH